MILIYISPTHNKHITQNKCSNLIICILLKLKSLSLINPYLKINENHMPLKALCFKKDHMLVEKANSSEVMEKW